jgi:hypothetical protein
MKRLPILISDLGKKDLEPIVEALNAETNPALRDQLCGLIQIWEDSGPNLQVMMARNPLLDARLRRSWQVGYRPQASGRAHLELIEGAPLSYTEMMSLYSRRAPEEGQAAFRAERDALLLFAQLTLNPQWKYFGGPCARCQRYYVKGRISQNKYCGPRCGSLATAQKSTNKSLAEARAKKVARANTLVRRWKTARTRQDWKIWIQNQTARRKLKITKKWLTIAVKENYGVKPPKKGEHHGKS